MRNKLGLLLIVFIVISPLANAQLDNLSLLGTLTDNLSQGANQVDDGDTNEPNEQINPDTTRTETANFTDEEYGFKGGKNFNNPPRSKFSDEPLEYFG